MRGFPIFVFLFLVVPIVEIYLLIQVGSVIGALPTILAVVATAVIGAYLLRQQGMSTLARFQQNMANGKMPTTELAEGVLLLLGGAFLMTPGFFTDTIGFLFLIPCSRRFIINRVISKALAKATMTGGMHTNQSADSGVFEGEFTEKPDQRLKQD